MGRGRPRPRTGRGSTTHTTEDRHGGHGPQTQAGGLGDHQGPALSMGSAYGQSAILGPGHDGGRFRGNPSTGGWRKCASSGQHGRHGRRQALSPTTRAALVGLRRLQFSAQSWHGRGVGVQPATRWPHADACWPLVSAQLLPHSAALPPQSQDTCPLPARAPWATVHPPPKRESAAGAHRGISPPEAPVAISRGEGAQMKWCRVPGRRRGTRGFPAAPRQRPRESFFNASRGPSPLP